MAEEANRVDPKLLEIPGSLPADQASRWSYDNAAAHE